MVGVQIPILLALFEYGALLAMKKYDLGKLKLNIIKVSQASQLKKPKIMDHDELAKTMDKLAFFASLGFIILFNIVYWITVQSL